MKKSTAIISLILLLLIGAVGFYIWNRNKEAVSSRTGLQEISISSEVSASEEDRGGCINSEANISALGDGQFLYENNDLGISLTYPEAWGNPRHIFQSAALDPGLIGTRCIVGFSSREAPVTAPALYISSNDFVFGVASDAWGLDANRVDLSKTDAELIDQLSFPWTTSMKLERRAHSGVDGIILEEEGVDPLEDTDYHRLYYIFPKYNEKESQNLIFTVLNYSNKEEAEDFLRMLEFVGSSGTVEQGTVAPSIPEGWRLLKQEQYGFQAVVPETITSHGCTQPVVFETTRMKFGVGAMLDPCAEEDPKVTDVFVGRSVIVLELVHSEDEIRTAFHDAWGESCNLRIIDLNRNEFEITATRQPVNEWAPNPCGLSRSDRELRGFYNQRAGTFFIWQETGRDFPVGDGAYVDDRVQFLPL